jgi:hypothetical protein
MGRGQAAVEGSLRCVPVTPGVACERGVLVYERDGNLRGAVWNSRFASAGQT